MFEKAQFTPSACFTPSPRSTRGTTLTFSNIAQRHLQKVGNFPLLLAKRPGWSAYKCYSKTVPKTFCLVHASQNNRPVHCPLAPSISQCSSTPIYQRCRDKAAHSSVPCPHASSTFRTPPSLLPPSPTSEPHPPRKRSKVLHRYVNTLALDTSSRLAGPHLAPGSCTYEAVIGQR